VVLPARDRDHVGCLPDQVKLTHAWNKELDQAMKGIHQFGDQEAEANRRIIELESLCKKHEGAIENMKKENATLELMVQSCDELIKEIATETGLDRMGEDDDEDDNEDEDDDDGGDVAAPPATMPPADATPATVAPELVVEEEEEDKEMMIPEQESPEALEGILSD
jgi:hypothetical protein